MTHFLGDFASAATSWQAFERGISRLLMAAGYEHVSLIGASGDGGADILAIKSGKRWLVQVKRWTNPIGSDVIERTIAAAKTYEADIPVIVSRSGFTAGLIEQRLRLASEGIRVQLWDRLSLDRQKSLLSENSPVADQPEKFALREYQVQACDRIVHSWAEDKSGSSLVVLATGLGKTFVAGESIRRMSNLKRDLRVLVLAHTNDLVYQLERAFWPFLRSDQATAIVNGVERPSWQDLLRFDLVFGSRDTFVNAAESGLDLGDFDVVVVDECHHLGSQTYDSLLQYLRVGDMGGPYLIGLSATPWRPGGNELDRWFDGPTVSIDLVKGLRTGYLANVDYRMFTDNVDWDQLRNLKGERFTPKAINRTLFINEWDDAVVERTAEAWAQLERGRGIIFCGTVSHAERMAERINALGFTNAAAIYSRGSDGRVMGPIQRSKILWDFSDGKIGILCAVDVLNEGVDVPDVNLVVFQRVTHSRRIFVQQLGRGLRLAPNKKSVIVLDFVSDVRRFAAGLELKHALEEPGPRPGNEVRVTLPSKVTFQRATKEDVIGASFLREWLGDLAEVEQAGEDVSVLRYPPYSNLPRD